MLVPAYRVVEQSESFQSVKLFKTHTPDLSSVLKSFWNYTDVLGYSNATKLSGFVG